MPLLNNVQIMRSIISVGQAWIGPSVSTNEGDIPDDHLMQIGYSIPVIVTTGADPTAGLPVDPSAVRIATRTWIRRLWLRTRAFNFR